jgi:multidrug resistance efflux pump
MADMSTLEVEADVSESSLAKVKVGQPAEIVLDALPTRASAAASAAWCRPSTAPRPR